MDRISDNNVCPGTPYSGHGTRVYAVDISTLDSYSTAFDSVVQLTPEQVW